jgi:predicted nucleic acid-binding protein
LVLTPRIIEETREAIRKVAPSEEQRLDDVLTASGYEEVPTPTEEEIQAHLHLVPRDPKDVHVALAAIQAKVDYLVSLDKDLTDPNQPIHQHIKVLLPAVFLREHMEWTSEALEAIRKRTWDELDTESNDPD